MRYYRPSLAPMAWGVGVALAIAAALVFAHRASLSRARADERAAVVREGDAILREALARGATLARERDSLARAVAHVDTVLVTRLRTIRDTAWLPDTILLTPAKRSAAVAAACRAHLDSLATDCGTYRRTATTALAKADTIRRGDSTVIAGLSLRLAETRRADSLKAVQLTKRPTWKHVVGGVLAGALVGVLTGVGR